MHYMNYLEDVPDKDSYRLSHQPQAGYGNVLISPWVIVTGASGTHYQFMRGYGISDKTTVVNFGAYKGNGVLDAQGPLVYPFSEHPAVEKYTVSETEDAVTYAGPTHSFTIGTTGYDWTDANGRIQLHGELLGQPCTFWVPEQDGLDHPMLSRSHLGTVTGTIDGDPVEGLWMHDHMYSTPGTSFIDTKFLGNIHNFWMNWLVQYDDGTYEGGHAWRGRPGTGFAAAHHYVDGHSIARTDAKIDVDFTERGSISTLRLTLGDDVSIEFEQHGSLDWPIHTYGTVKSISRDKKVVKSWNYSEHFPLNWELVEEFQTASARLYGRYPSFQGMLENASLRNGKIVFNRR